MRRLLLLFVAAALVLLATAATSLSARVAPRQPCDPIQTPPVFRGETPTAEQVLGFPLGSREVTAAETAEYVEAVDAASPRVVAGTLGRSWEDRPIPYALVGTPENVGAAGLAAVREAAQRLRDPATPAPEAANLAEQAPAIVWLMGNVHGGEESATDAELRVLYELADRDDCAARQILDNTVVGIIPTQNPDGREAETRQNFYGFDMNRDWFARTQPETDAKLELLRQYPGVLHIDAHEMGGKHYFAPPAADPIYHEVTDETVDWTDNIYGAAIGAEFDRQHIQHFSDKVFDFFAMVYGDTVPSVGFGSAGMTFEKSNSDPIAQRTYEHYVSHWVSISQAALNKERILREWHASWVEAFAQGVAGQLEPNQVNDKGNEVTRLVPDERVRHYFLRADDPAKANEVEALVRRLQRMDVNVYRLTAPLPVPDFTPYARGPAPTLLPAGTYWIPTAQMQKHWIQALLNEDTYVPFRYFYDVSGWSNPLLFNVDGGRSGAVLAPSAELLALLPEPGAPALPPITPRVAVFRPSGGTSAFESSGWLRYLLDQVWHLPYTLVQASQIEAGALAGVDVLLVPNGDAEVAANALGPRGRRALVDWVNAGGDYVGWRNGGAPLAARLGITTALLAAPKSDVAGALIRVRTDPASPLAAGVGRFAWVFYDYDVVMTPSDPAHAALRFPPAGSEDFFVSGFADDEEELAGTAAVIDEPVGGGRVVLFGSDPNYRAWTVGMQRVLWNAVLGPAASAGTAAPAGSPGRAAREAKARQAATALPSLDSPIRLTVSAGSAEAAKTVLERFGARFTIRQTGRKARFLIANPGGLSAEEHPFVAQLPEEFERAGVDVIVLSMP